MQELSTGFSMGQMFFYFQVWAIKILAFRRYYFLFFGVHYQAILGIGMKLYGMYASGW